VADYFMTLHGSQKRLDEFEQHIVCGTKSKVIKTLRSLKFIEIRIIFVEELVRGSQKTQRLHCKGPSEDACFCSKEESVKTMGKMLLTTTEESTDLGGIQEVLLQGP
jgi:phosphosulfolactate phosphohydrolase-like enzyme